MPKVSQIWPLWQSIHLSRLVIKPLPAGRVILFAVLSLLIFFKINFTKKKYWNTMKVSNRLDPDKAECQA